MRNQREGGYETIRQLYKEQTGKDGTIDQSLGWFIATNYAGFTDTERREFFNHFLKDLPIDEYESAVKWLNDIQTEGMEDAFS